MALVIGGSGSGKSAFAEDYMEALHVSGEVSSGGRKKYYIATMQASDEESRLRIARHKELRKGKNFVTIEQPLSVFHAAERMEEGERAALLECVSNLAANEMFGEGMGRGEEAVAEKIVEGIAGLKEETAYLVVVSNNVFEDGKVYDEDTMSYIRAMGLINERLAAMADEVIEVVSGIPVRVKGMG